MSDPIDLPTADGRTVSWFEEYLAAWNDHDADRVAAWFADDAVLEDTTLGYRVEGRSAIGRFAARSFRRVPDFRFEFVEGFDDGRRYAMRWVMQPGGVPGASYGSLRDGRIEAHRDYWDGRRAQVP